MSSRLWITPENDLEAVTIRDLLAEHQQQHLVTAQPWGASWAGLEPEILEGIEQYRQQNPEGVIYGIELSGKAPAGAINIDHHVYPGDDRSNKLCSLEQVAKILGIGALSREQELVAANDKGWIPALREKQASEEEIQRIRRRDREAQGISAADELQAQLDVQRMQKLRDLIVVDCAKKPNSVHSDLLEGQARQILLRSEQQWFYSGPRHRLLGEMQWPEKHWGGGGEKSGFFGIDAPSLASQERILDVALKLWKAEIPESTHMECILYLPLRLDSFGELYAERSNPDTSPNEWLRKCSEWLRSESGGTWKKPDAAGAGMEERNWNYASFVYYHPFVHDLFPLEGPDRVKSQEGKEKLNPSLTLHRTDVKGLRILLAQEANGEGISFDDPAACLRDHPKAIEFQVKKVDLSFFLMDIAILRVHLVYAEAKGTDLHKMMNMLNQVRHIYPSYWKNWEQESPHSGLENMRPPGQDPVFAQWQVPGAEVGAKIKVVSNNANRLYHYREAEKLQSPVLMPHWAALLDPLVPFDANHKPTEGLTFNLLGDNRAFLAVSLQVDRFDDIQEPEWMRLAFVDEGGGGWAYNEAFLDAAETKKNHFYDRFSHWGTRYLVTSYSFIQVMQAGGLSHDIYRHHLLHHYNRLCLLGLIQKNSILNLSHRLAEVLAEFTNSGRDVRDRYHNRCRQLANDLSTYVALYDFAEVSSQLQAIELFDMLRKHLRVKPLFEELKQQVEFTINEEGKNYEEYIQRALRFFIPASLAVGILGFSFAFDEYSKFAFGRGASSKAEDIVWTIGAFLFPVLLAGGVAWAAFWLGKKWLNGWRPWRLRRE